MLGTMSIVLLEADPEHCVSLPCNRRYDIQHICKESGSLTDRSRRNPPAARELANLRSRNLRCGRRGICRLCHGRSQKSEWQSETDSFSLLRKGSCPHTGLSVLTEEQQQVLLALHKSWLHEHHNFSLALPHSSTNPAKDSTTRAT